MTVKVVGSRQMSFTDDKTGELVEGTSVFYLHEDAEVDGFAAAKKFFKKGTKLPRIVPGTEYVMEFGPQGRLLSFNPILEKKE